MERRFTFEFGDAMRTRPVVDDGLVYLGADNGLFVLDAETGNRQRHVPFDHWVRTTPEIVDGTVCLCVNDDSYRDKSGTVYTLDGKRGVEHWAIECNDRITGLAANNRLAAYSCDRQVYGIDIKEGTERWQFDNRSFEDDSENRIIKRLAADEDHVYVGTHDGSVRALDVASGDVVWRFNIGSRPTTIFVDEETVYAGSHGDSPAAGEPVLYALDAAMGSQRWRLSQDHGLRRPTRQEDALLVTSYEQLYAVDADTGELFWERSVGTGVTNPVAMADRVYVATEDGELSVHDLYNGTEEASRQFEGTFDALGGDAGYLLVPVTDEDVFGTTLHTFDVPHDAGTATDDEDVTAPTDSEHGGDGATGDTCPSCNASLAGDEAFCPQCGHELADPECPSCGTELAGDEQFCPQCGHER